MSVVYLCYRYLYFFPSCRVFFPPFFCPPQWTLTLAAASRLAQFRNTRKSFPHVSSRVQVSISLLSDFTMLIHNVAPDCKEYTRPATSVPQCWSCHRGVSLKEKFFCSSCGAIQPTKDKNFFEIFNVYLSLQHSLILWYIILSSIQLTASDRRLMI
jgi:hypothetical protein